MIIDRFAHGKDKKDIPVETAIPIVETIQNTTTESIKEETIDPLKNYIPPVNDPLTTTDPLAKSTETTDINAPVPSWLQPQNTETTITNNTSDPLGNSAENPISENANNGISDNFADNSV